MIVMDKKLIFGELCEQTLINQYEKEFSGCRENAKCSDKHYEKLGKIIGEKLKKNSRVHRRLLAALIAAIMILLAGCTAYVYRDEIKGFIVEICEKYTRVTPEEDDGTGDMIDKAYSVGYIPAGYVKTDGITSGYRVYYEYQNEKGQTISFTQKKTLDSYFNTEYSSEDVLSINYGDIYCRSTENSYYYIWEKNGYYITLKTDAELDADELERIINGFN